MHCVDENGMDPDQLASNVKVWIKGYVHSTFKKKNPMFRLPDSKSISW